MITQRFRWLPALLLLCGTPGLLLAQLRDPLQDLTTARRIYIPTEQLDTVIERDKQGVILSRDKFEAMLAKAKANAEKNPVPASGAVVLTVADYAARIVGDQLLISVTAEINQFDNGWRQTEFALQRLSLEQVSLDDGPALVGRSPGGPMTLFTSGRGKHVLKMELSTELTSQGSDQAAAFSLLNAPSGAFTISLPAGKRLIIGNLQLERPTPLDQPADYRVAVGGTGGMQLRITDRATENAADALMFATTGYGLSVAPGEVTWRALTTLQVFGKPIVQVTCSVPASLQIADIEATGLEAWKLSDDANQPGRTIISLSFSQPFDGTRKIDFKGVMAAETGQTWSVPSIQITGVTSHIGQVVIQHQAGLRLRIEEATGLRRATAQQQPAADMPDDIVVNAIESLRFDSWQPDFVLKLTTQPKQREVQAAVASVLDVNASGLELQAVVSVESHFAPLFELDVRFPSEWQVREVRKDDQPINWQMARLDEPGVNQLRILLDPPLPADSRGQLKLVLRREVEGWPVESTPIVVGLPELFLPQSTLTEGALVVRSDADLDLTAFDLKGLDSVPLKADFERLRFLSQDTRFEGKLQIMRKPSRVSAQSVIFGRIDPQTYHVFLQAIVEVQGGGVRSIKLALPEATGTALRFVCQHPLIVEQKAAPPENGERVWTLQFDQRLLGQAVIVCDLELPRGESKEFQLPQWRFLDTERQSSFIALEAAGEQRLTIVANESGGTPLAEVDPLELPPVSYFPKERIVSVLQAVGPGAVIKLSEQRFDKVAVPTAVCRLLEMATILDQSGELQHKATFYLNVVGVQGLHLTFPEKTALWATTVDHQPVEVRRTGDVYLVPLTAGNVGPVPTSAATVPTGAGRVVELFYRSEVAAVSQFGTLIQQPPALTVESGMRTALPVEVLEQKWNLYYPEQTRLINSHSALEPMQPLDTTSLLGEWNANWRVPTTEEFGRQLAIVLVTLAALWMLTAILRRYQTPMFRVLGVVGMLAVLVVGSIIFFTFAAQERSNSDYYATEAESPYRDSLEEDARPAAKAVKIQSEAFGEKAKEAGPAGLKSHTIRNRTAVPMPRFVQPAKPAQADAAKQEAIQDEMAQNAPAPAAAPAAAPEEGAEARQAPLASQPPPQHAKTGGLLSLGIDFVPPAGSREKTFHYVGADSSTTGTPLEVDYLDRRSGAALRVFAAAVVILLGWQIRRSCVRSKVALTTVGLILPIALSPVAPAGWQVVLDGILFGSLINIVVWMLRACPCLGGSCGPVKCPSSVVAAMMFSLLTISSGTAWAADKPVAKAALPPEPKPPTVVIPYDAGTQPLASDRVMLSQEQFLNLYRLANPDGPVEQPSSQMTGIVEALYAAELVVNAKTPDESVVRIKARYAVRSFVDGPLPVDLPVRQVSIASAKIDGETAALTATADRYQVVVPKSGWHVIDLSFDVPAKISGATGSFTLPLQAVPAGKLAFQLPEKDLSIRVNGSSTVFRKVTTQDKQSLELAVDKAADYVVTWQPPQSQTTASAVINVDSVQSVMLRDVGCPISHGFDYRIRQGGIADASFSLPANLRLQSVSGPDVGGWEVKGEGDARQLRVLFRRNVTDRSLLTIDTYLDTKVGDSALEISVPQITPLEITNEIGQVAVFVGNQFAIRVEQAEGLSQIDVDRFATQLSVVRPKSAPSLAYRFSKRPYSLKLRATRQVSQSHVVAHQASLMTLRKQQLTTRLTYQLTGAPRSSLSITLPAGYVLLDVQATALRDWYTSKQDDQSLLSIELRGPQLGQIEVVLGGYVARDNATASVKFPQPVDVTKQDSTAVFWLDEGFTGSLESFEGWRSIDPARVADQLRSIRPNQTAQFAFTSSSATPSPIVVKLSQAAPRLTANGLSIVTVTDVAVVYTLALQWKVDAAKTDTLSLTAPSWLARKLDFQGEGLVEAAESSVDADRTRWTIRLRTAVSGNYFATATASLPPAGKEVLAPLLVFENDRSPLESQRQYVLLVNSSTGQLSMSDATLVEPVQREDVPVVVQQEIIDQATELVRVKTLKTAPKWTLNRLPQQAVAPASVNVADMQTVLSRDGTYRAQAIYTIKNRSRQFLALKLPENVELLSVFVAGQPSRAVTTQLAGSAVQLIALPKTSAASLSFPVKIVWRGRLDTPMPRAAKLIADEIAIPAPQILNQQDDAEYGIPVARTRWTVYLPKDIEAHAARSTSRHNLSLSTEVDNLYGQAAWQESEELFGVLRQIVVSNQRTQSKNNLKQIGVAINNMKALSQRFDQLSNYSDPESQRQRAELSVRLKEAEQLAREETDRTNLFFSQQQQAEGASQSDFNEVELSIAQGQAIANNQQRGLIISNRNEGPLLPTENRVSTFNYQLLQKDVTDAESKAAAGKSGKDDKKSPASEPVRRNLQISNDRNLEELNSDVNTANTQRAVQGRARQQMQQINNGQVPSSTFTNNGNGLMFDNSGSNLWGSRFGVPTDSSAISNAGTMPIITNNSFGSGGMMSGMGGGQLDGRAGNENNDFDKKMLEPNDPALLGLQNNFFNGLPQFAQDAGGGAMGGAGNLGFVRKQGGGLSLDIDLPTTGQKLVFTKVGGDPRLALVVRPQAAIRHGIGLLWSVIWTVIGLSVLFALGNPDGANQIRHRLAIAAIVVGVLSFFVLPLPLRPLGFVLFVVGAIATIWLRRTSIVTGQSAA